MILFNPADVKPETADAPPAEGDDGRFPATAHHMTPAAHRRLTRARIRRKEALEAIGQIQPGEIVTMVGANKWNTQDVIAVCCDLLDEPADFSAAVYSVSDSAVRQLAALKKSGALRSINMVVNHHQARTRPAITAYLRQIADRVGLYPAHAKTYVLRGDTRGITIVSSANLTACPWLEVGMVTCDKSYADWSAAWIDQAIRLAKPFDAVSMSASVRKEVEAMR